MATENLVDYPSFDEEREEKEEDELTKNWRIILQETSHFTPQLRHVEIEEETMVSQLLDEPSQQDDTIDAILIP